MRILVLNSLLNNNLSNAPASLLKPHTLQILRSLHTQDMDKELEQIYYYYMTSRLEVKKRNAIKSINH